MNSDLKLMELLVKTKELGITNEEFEAFKSSFIQKHDSMSEEDIKKVFSPVTPFDGMTDEEILFWATPYFDTLQEEKELKKQRIEGEIRNGTQDSTQQHDSNRLQGEDLKSAKG